MKKACICGIFFVSLGWLRAGENELTLKKEKKKWKKACACKKNFVY